MRHFTCSFTSSVLLLSLFASPICSTALYAQNQNPNLKETFDWMHAAFPDSRSMVAFRAGQTREFNYTDNNGDPSCTVILVDRWTTEGKPMTRNTVIDLSRIDPNSIRSYREDDTLENGAGGLMMVATNDKKIIVETQEVNGKKDDKRFTTDREFISFINPEYAERFSKAFKNAVRLCGGKASTF